MKYLPRYTLPSRSTQSPSPSSHATSSSPSLTPLLLRPARAVHRRTRKARASNDRRELRRSALEVRLRPTGIAERSGAADERDPWTSTLETKLAGRRRRGWNWGGLGGGVEAAAVDRSLYRGTTVRKAGRRCPRCCPHHFASVQVVAAAVLLPLGRKVDKCNKYLDRFQLDGTGSIVR